MVALFPQNSRKGFFIMVQGSCEVGTGVDEKLNPAIAVSYEETNRQWADVAACY